MKKFTNNSRVFVTVAVMAVMLLLPMKSKAQTKMDGFFDNSFDNFADRTLTWEYVAVNQTFGQNNDTPIGTGLLIMTIACAGYAIIKKKEY